MAKDGSAYFGLGEIPLDATFFLGAFCNGGFD